MRQKAIKGTWKYNTQKICEGRGAKCQVLL